MLPFRDAAHNLFRTSVGDSSGFWWPDINALISARVRLKSSNLREN
jgi:hypothetical protein